MSPYYEKDGIIIYHGDCFEIMPQLDQKFDAIMADLPYNITLNDWDVLLPIDVLWIVITSLIKEVGTIALFGNSKFLSDLISTNRKLFRFEWVWRKNRGIGFQIAKYRPLIEVEYILIFGTKIKYNPQKVSITPVYEPYMFSKSKTSPIANNKLKGKFKLVDSRYPSNCLDFPIVVNSLHPTQKPEALLQYLIKTHTDEGDIILDNTMGSGTTLVAAKATKRRAVGIDISEEYCEIAAKRLEGYTPKEIKNKIDITNKRLF